MILLKFNTQLTFICLLLVSILGFAFFILFKIILKIGTSQSFKNIGAILGARNIMVNNTEKLQKKKIPALHSREADSDN